MRDDLGMTFLVVSHRLRELMGLVETLVAINLGRKIAEGTPQEIAVNETVIDAYLGRRQQYV
jgi:branched-chain amino acid transport system ATP-binding protein